MALANYYPYPGTTTYPNASAGVGTFSLSLTSLPGALGLGSIARLALRAVAGYYLGSYFRHPVAGAIVGATFGLPGMFVMAVVSPKPVVTVPNQPLPNRKRRRARRYRRGGWR